ncbi:MAG: hypothetical protein ACERLM_12280 [Acidimicrobiales bacterium]
MSMPGSDMPSSEIGWAWFPGETSWQRAHLALRTTIAGTGLEVRLDRPGHHLRVELLDVVGLDALGGGPDGFDWVELTVQGRPQLQLIWPERLTGAMLTALRATTMAPAVVPLATPGVVHDPILERATATNVLDLRESSEKRGRLVALSALSALSFAVLVAGGALAWTMLADDGGPDTKVSVAGITQTTPDAVTSTTVPPPTTVDPAAEDTSTEDG